MIYLRVRIDKYRYLQMHRVKLSVDDGLAEHNIINVHENRAYYTGK